ncbi:hypothetical protein GCM10027341_48900 [Spirosoma knui]
MVHAHCQEQPRTKILLLGTIHFTPSPTDTYKNEAMTISSNKRQQEINAVVERLAKFQPNQICIEMTLSEQQRMDSIYQQFLKGSYQLKNDEIDQLALPTAQKAGLKRVTCVNYRGRYEPGPVVEFAKNNDQLAITTASDEYGRSCMAEIEQKQKSQSVGNFLAFLNTPYALNKNLAYYTNYLARIGKGNNYIGTDLVADWYATNLHIYTNIIRAIQPSDKAIIVIFGQGHIPILKHLFESNATFEVVEVDKILAN